MFAALVVETPHPGLTNYVMFSLRMGCKNHKRHRCCQSSWSIPWGFFDRFVAERIPIHPIHTTRVVDTRNIPWNNLIDEEVNFQRIGCSDLQWPSRMVWFTTQRDTLWQTLWWQFWLENKATCKKGSSPVSFMRYGIFYYVGNVISRGYDTHIDCGIS